MTHKNRFLKSAGYGLVLSAIALLMSSCIDAMYDLSNGVSKDMVLGGDSLAIPIGSTDTIRLRDNLPASVLEKLKVMEDGGWAFNIKDSIEPTIPIIDQSKLKIEDQAIPPINTTINFGDINLENFKIPGLNVEKNIILSFGSYSLGSFPVGPLTGGTTQPVGLNAYSLKTPAISISPVVTAQNDLFSFIPDPPSGPTVDVPVSNQSISIDASGTISSTASVPGSVTNIKDVELESGEMAVTIELVGASDAFTSGTLVPNFSIDPHGLFVFKNSTNGNKIQFGNDEKLTRVNNYKVTKTTQISSLGISGTPESGFLPISGKLDITGEMALQDALVNSANFSEFKGMDMKVTIAVNNMVISSMVFDVPTQHIAAGGSTNLSINNNSIPTQIDSIGSILFTDPSTIIIDVKANQYMPAINSKIDELSIKFPKEFVFDESNNDISYENGRPVYKITDQTFNPKAGKKIVLKLKELKMNKQVSGGLTWSGTIDFLGNLSFGGTMNSKDLPTGENDAVLSINFTSDLTFNSAVVKTTKILVPELNVKIPIEMESSISTMVKQLSVIKLKDNTKIRIDIQLPDGLPFDLTAENFKLQFPSFFMFNPDKNPPMPGNTYTITSGAMPDSIVLYLDALALNDELKDGMLKLSDNVFVSGKLALKPGWVNSTEISTIGDKNLSVKASTSDLKISSTIIKLNDLYYPYKDSIPLKFDIPDVPTQLVSLDSVLLKDNASIQLAVNITNMPDCGSPINMDLTIDFPDLFILAPGSVNEKNQLVIHEPIVGGKINRTIGIRGLKFDGKDLNGILKIDKQLKYNAAVNVSSPIVNSDNLVGKTINIAVEAKISNIAFKSVYGELDAGIDPISQNIPLETISQQLADNNIDVVLDVTKPMIAINTECNLGMPIVANVVLTPMIGGSPSIPEPIDITLKIPKAPLPKDTLKTAYWISPDSAGMPTGANFIKANVQDLFKKIPENVKMTATVSSDKTQQHFFDVTATYKFKLGYEVTIPFAFGKDLKIKIEKNITFADPKIGEMASMVGGIEVLGTIENSIPLELNLALIPIDADSLPIAGIDTVKQIISAGAHDGSGVVSLLTLKMSDRDDKLKELRGFKLIFSASSNETVAGTPIKPENFVKANLKVRVDGGINIKDLVGNK